MTALRGMPQQQQSREKHGSRHWKQAQALDPRLGAAPGRTESLGKAVKALIDFVEEYRRCISLAGKRRRLPASPSVIMG